MNLDYLRATQSVVLTLIVSSITILKEVQGTPIAIYENESPVGIYTDDSWSLSNDDKEYQQSSSWIMDVNEKQRRDEPNVNCVKGSCITPAMIENPVKKEMFTSRGWGAGGMPFNVLYMKNPKPPKSLRSQYPQQSQGIIAEPLRSQPLLEPIPQAQQQLANPSYTSMVNFGEMTPQNVPNGLPPNRNHRTKSRSSGSALFVPSRRHYSIIPQLFVSYGWGPIGK